MFAERVLQVTAMRDIVVKSTKSPSLTPSHPGSAAMAVRERAPSLLPPFKMSPRYPIYQAEYFPGMEEEAMKRWLALSLVLLLAVMVVTAAGCGSGGDAASGEGGDSSPGGTIGQAEAASCAANRKTVSMAAQSYYAMEGSYPSSIQALVPEFLQSAPACPAGGRYTLQGSTVTCSIHGS